MDQILTSMFLQTQSAVSQPAATGDPTLTQHYLGFLEGHPIVTGFISLVVISMVAKALPRVVGSVVGLVSNTLWDVTKQTGLAVAGAIIPNFSPRQAGPAFSTYVPKANHTFRKGDNDNLLTVHNVTDKGVIEYHYSSGNADTKHLAVFRALLASNGYQRI